MFHQLCLPIISHLLFCCDVCLIYSTYWFAAMFAYYIPPTGLFGCLPNISHLLLCCDVCLLYSTYWFAAMFTYYIPPTGLLGCLPNISHLLFCCDVRLLYSTYWFGGMFAYYIPPTGLLGCLPTISHLLFCCDVCLLYSTYWIAGMFAYYIPPTGLLGCLPTTFNQPLFYEQDAQLTTYTIMCSDYCQGRIPLEKSNIIKFLMLDSSYRRRPVANTAPHISLLTLTVKYSTYMTGSHNHSARLPPYYVWRYLCLHTTLTVCHVLYYRYVCVNKHIRPNIDIYDILVKYI